MKNKRMLAIFLSILLMLSSLSGIAWADGEETTNPTEAPAATEVPATQAPATEAPATQAPVTEAPPTQAPVTEAPPTQAPVTEAPPTQAPATEAPATEAPATEAPATEAPATEVPATEVPATDTPATEVPATDTPATDTPATEVPATDTPATDTPATEVPATDAPATATAVPEVTPVPVYPRIVFDAEGVIQDLTQIRQTGYIMVALPIGYEISEGNVIWSNIPGEAASDWTVDSAAHPAYFRHDLAQYLTEAEWKVQGEGFELSHVFDMSGGDVQNIMAYAPKDNEWNIAEGAVFSMGYAVFKMPIWEDAEGGSYAVTFEFLMPAEAANADEELKYTIQFTLGPAPTEEPTDEPTEEPTDEPWGEPTDEPIDEPTDEPWGDEWGDDEGGTSMGTVMVGQSEVKTVKVKQTGVTLSVPVSYVVDNMRIYSNHSDEGTVVEPGQASEMYSQEILEYIDWLEISVSPEAAASDSFPFQLSEQGVGKAVIADGENFGYAVFKDLTVKSGLSNGTMAVPLTVRWMEMGDDTIYSTDISALINVTGASSGGGGGGGSYVAPTTPPQARVLVESLRTDPAKVKAGEQFDLIMTLRNTSASQYVQNMQVTVTSEEDVLIPLSGSNTLYIDRIDKDATYELRYPVRANMEIPDRPIRVDVMIEYEDSNVSAQSASQTLVVNVEQNRRVKIDEPVLDNAAPMVGDSVTASLQVINEGRTVLYNMTVTAQCDSENVLLPVSSYLGNMEGGTSKKAELDLIPLAAGDYTITLQVSYEDAMGMQYTDTRSIGFYTQEETYYDDYYYYEDDYNASGYEDYEEPGLTAETVMQLLPGWIYAAGGTMLAAVIVLMGVSARSKRRKAFEDDEMD